MVSVIIPVYNEESTIRKTLSALPYQDGLEVIVVDGESQDRTGEFARAFPARVVECAKNRALQMNKGAQLATQDTLVFLHADCQFERGSLEAIRYCLNDGYIGGCLSLRITSDKTIYRFIEASGNIRAKLFKVFYGDQAIFVKKNIFLRLGGFDNVALFEDVLFSRKMKKEGRVRVLNNKVFVSARRWEKNGIVKTTVIFWLLTLGFYLGLPYNRLQGLYRDIR